MDDAGTLRRREVGVAHIAALAGVVFGALHGLWTLEIVRGIEHAVRPHGLAVTLNAGLTCPLLYTCLCSLHAVLLCEFRGIRLSVGRTSFPAYGLLDEYAHNNQTIVWKTWRTGNRQSRVPQLAGFRALRHPGDGLVGAAEQVGVFGFVESQGAGERVENAGRGRPRYTRDAEPWTRELLWP